MNPREKLHKLASHYGIDRKKYSYAELVSVVKERANGKLESIDAIYQRVFNPAPSSATNSSAKKIPIVSNVEAAKKIDEENVSGKGSASADTTAATKTTALEPAADVTTASPIHEVRVDGARMIFNLTPAAVSVHPVELSLAHHLQSVAHSVFVFTAGVMLGVLVSSHVLKRLGLALAAQ